MDWFEKNKMSFGQKNMDTMEGRQVGWDDY